MENVQFQLVEHNNQRILTTAQIAAAYGTDAKHINDNFQNNKGRYTVGKHYYCLEGGELKQFKAHDPESFGVVNRINKLYLWTEKGALMHAKSLNTDKAWDVYEKLVDEYYRLLLQRDPQEPTYTLGDALRLRALANEDHVPSDLFAIQVEFGRELYHWEKVVNACLDNKAQIEISVGKCWWNYARSELHMQVSQRRQYQHLCPNGRMVKAWAYPIHYLSAFRRWLKEIYFVEKFPAYQRYRTKRIGAPTEQLSTKDVRTHLLLARSGMAQLPLFSEAIA